MSGFVVALGGPEEARRDCMEGEAGLVVTVGEWLVRTGLGSAWFMEAVGMGSSWLLKVAWIWVGLGVDGSSGVSFVGCVEDGAAHGGGRDGGSGWRP